MGKHPEVSSLSKLVGIWPVILDSSSLLTSITMDNKYGDVYVSEFGCQADSSDYFIKLIKEGKGRLWTTRQIVDEYLIERKAALLAKKKKLSFAFESTGAILCFEETREADYNILHSRHQDRRDKYSLREAGYDLVISSLLFSRFQEPCFLISNNDTLLNLADTLVGLEDLDRTKIGFFTRTHFDEYKNFLFE